MFQQLFFALILVFSNITQFYGVNSFQKEAPNWLLEQIREDLLPFSQTGITKQMLDSVQAQCETNSGLTRFKIFDNKLSITFNQNNPLKHRLSNITNAIETLCNSTSMPNIDFIVCVGDAFDKNDLSGPVFTFAKAKSTQKSVLIPDFEALSGNLKILKAVKKGIRKYPWNAKLPLAYWRGATTGGGMFTVETFLKLPRSYAVLASLKHPHLIDARFIGVCQTKNPQEILEKFPRYFGNSSEINKHLKYKYQLLIDGNSCAYSRAYWQLFSNCLMLKQTSPNIQWYYKGIKPYIHYVPLKENLEDIEEKISWAVKHDREVLEMIRNAQKFANENLQQSEVLFHLYVILNEYAKLQVFES